MVNGWLFTELIRLVFTENGLVDAPDERPDVMDMLGTQFKAHPPIGPFPVEVVNKDHELTKGIEDFEIVDELYLSNTTAPDDTLMQTTFEGEATLALLRNNGTKQPFPFYILETLERVG